MKLRINKLILSHVVHLKLEGKLSECSWLYVVEVGYAFAHQLNLLLDRLVLVIVNTMLHSLHNSRTDDREEFFVLLGEKANTIVVDIDYRGSSLCFEEVRDLPNKRPFTHSFTLPAVCLVDLEDIDF